MQQSKKPHKTSSMEKWRCSVCQFDNLALMSSCEMCQTQRKRQPKPLAEDSSKEATIQCPNSKCKKINRLNKEQCSSCGQLLFPSEQQEQIKNKKSKEIVVLINCKGCGFQNSPDNDVCINCDKRIIAPRIRTKSLAPKKAARSKLMKNYYEPCQKCGEQLKVINYSTRQTDMCMKCEMKQPFAHRKYLCLFCDKNLSIQEDKVHDETCEQRKKFYGREGNSTYARCTELQYNTMIYMHKKCQRLHYRSEKALIERIKKLGYSNKDLENLHHYIMHYAPIIIHMHVNTHFHFFVKDTHYRNQFQTSMSSGSLSHSARTGWEDRMFDKKHHSATGYERVKYGTMNFTNDPTGVKVCAGYGQSYFLLKPHVRDRCTITDMDSSSPSSTLGTFRFIFHLLMKLSDAELNSAFEGSKGKEMKSNVIGAYKEIQIHGPVEFSQDVERVYISKQELLLGDAKTLLQQVKTFCSKNKIQYELFSNPVVSPSVSVFAGFGVHGTVVQSAPERIVGDKKDLTEEEMKPKPPPVPPVGSVFGGYAFGHPPAFGLGVGGHGFGYSSIFSPAPLFGAPAPIPKKPEKPKQYGVDYI